METLEELEEALANHVARASEKIRRYGPESESACRQGCIYP